MPNPVSWVHEKLCIPQAADGEAVFGAPKPPPDPLKNTPKLPLTVEPAPQAALTAVAIPVQDTADKMTPALAETADKTVGDWTDEIEAMLAQAESMAQFRELLLSRYSALPSDQLVTVMAAALAAIDLRGRAEVLGGE